jgi:hypothetical protein
MSGDSKFALMDKLAGTNVDLGSWPAYIGLDMNNLKNLGFDYADLSAETASLAASYAEMRRSADQRANLMGAGVHEVFAGLDVEPSWFVSLTSSHRTGIDSIT